MATIKFQIDDSRAVAKLQLLAKAAANPQPVYATIGRVLVNRIRLCFKLGIDPWGNPWQALKFRAPRTSAKTGRLTKYGKAQVAANVAGKAGQPLVNTGTLRNSVVSRVDATGVTIGTNQNPRARTHQFGAEILPKKGPRLVFPGPNGQLVFAKKVTVPARPFLPLRRAGGTVSLPVPWALEVVRALKVYLQKAADKVPA